MAKKYRYRSAVTGEYVSRLYALLHPSTTVKERVGDTPGSSGPA